MSDDFIDSNVFVYLFDEVDGRKRGIAEYLVTDALDSGSGVISYQVIQETLNVITRKLPAPATREDADHFMRQVLEPLWSVAPSIPLYPAPWIFRRVTAMGSMTPSSSPPHSTPVARDSIPRTCSTGSGSRGLQ